RADGRWRFGRIAEVVSDPATLDVLWFTCWQAVASTALTLAVALPGAYVFARFDFPGKGLLRAVVTVPFVLPTVVAGSAVLALHAWTVRRRESALRLVDPGRTARRPKGPAQWALLWGVLAVVALLIVTPLAVLVERSLNGPDGYGFTYYEALRSAADSGGT